MNTSSMRTQVWADDRGAVAMIFALSITALFGCIALAVDMNRAVSTRIKLSQILDAASLAGAKMLDQDVVSDDAVEERIQNFVAAQLPIAGIPATAFAKLTISIDRNSNTVTVTGAGKLPTQFARAIGFPTVDIATTSKVTYHMRDVELSLVLDLTGSMAEVPAGDTRTKLESLKIVAKSAVDTLYGQAVNERGIRIALAPYSSAVNTGTYASKVMTQSGYTPSTYYSSFTGPQPTDACAVERTGPDNATDASPASGGKLRPLAEVGEAGNICPTSTIMPLAGRSAQGSLKTTIDGFTANGSTAGHIGAAWGWYMLSPNWSGIFKNANAPGAYGDSNVSKNLVLMTDGLFNTSYLSGQPAGSSGASAESYTQFDALCAGMKAKGINIYTIGFGLNDATAQDKLSKCASAAANFFPAANGAELQVAFSAIVVKLNQLRVSK